MRLHAIKTLLCFILSISLIFSSTILVFAEGNSLQQADIKILTDYFKQKLNERKINIDNFAKSLHNRTVQTVSITDVQFDAAKKTVSVKLKLNSIHESTSNVTYGYQLRMSESDFQFGFCTVQEDYSGKLATQELWFPNYNAPSSSRPAADEDVNSILNYIKKTEVPGEDDKPSKPTEPARPTAPANPTHSNQNINQGNESDETTAIDNNLSANASKTENTKKSFWQRMVDSVKKIGQSIGNFFKSAYNKITGKSKSEKNEESGTNTGTQPVDNKDSKPNAGSNVKNEPEDNKPSADTSKDENVKKSFGQKIVDGIKNIGQAIGNFFKSAYNKITGKSKSEKNEESETNTESTANTESNASQNDEAEETVDAVESETNKPTTGGRNRPQYIPE